MVCLKLKHSTDTSTEDSEDEDAVPLKRFRKEGQPLPSDFEEQVPSIALGHLMKL